MYDRIVQLERLVMSLMPAAIPGGSGSGPTRTPAAASNHPSEPAPDPGPDPGFAAPPSRGMIITPTDTALPAVDAPTSLDVQSECGSMRVTPSELRYVGGDHWAAILDSIADLKDHFDREEQFQLARDDQEPAEGHELDLHSAGSQSTHALLLYGCRLPASRAELLAALPPKSAVDRYISRYFNRLDLVHCELAYTTRPMNGHGD